MTSVTRVAHSILYDVYIMDHAIELHMINHTNNYIYAHTIFITRVVRVNGNGAPCKETTYPSIAPSIPEREVVAFELLIH